MLMSCLPSNLFFVLYCLWRVHFILYIACNLLKVYTIYTNIFQKLLHKKGCRTGVGLECSSSVGLGPMSLCLMPLSFTSLSYSFASPRVEHCCIQLDTFQTKGALQSAGGFCTSKSPVCTHKLKKKKKLSEVSEGQRQSRKTVCRQK